MFVIPEGRAFQAAVPHLWNELPLQLQAIESLEVFNESTKAFLFKQSLFSSQACYPSPVPPAAHLAG